ncbi:putative Zinc finger, RanBP2-type, endonuclease/exonuclease/phosphatase [Helianthus annuus]|uniref:Putative endonuclease/exonuclease/phosphatase family protein n=1 Tax=Helianthus annuus TaxID=4232 RepID=A0A251S6L5_HELAN|nr:tyrosyl-DNA phosphodiesterase 2 isoform X1 [Helianthus annuus]KAF5763424.1 putative Zinc finger, RanBP2-type, endonuclease/exonuclease/phosphatase [Helianthus annuus]KAJ0454317.1 putative Zinc finger, RanBP2-type, endonuclease/exonuclease/phosphatase [Helianthus annuus]KAJ0472082.1 putative Zinc finger, RanBP2-type, endonuclease/exonuclease/phosphatase [Helianthus annuus]KAJ0651553.1 putative Zinc finger, RanBP2-type, endonuclease/exonuclease/phosphatase [Helianthus annuus]KAJ0830169.1 puta
MSYFKISIPTFKTLSFLLISKNPRKTLISFSISPKSMASSWACSKCTFINTDSLKPTCQICLSSKPNSPFSSSSSSSSNQEKWSCKACTFLNPYKVSNCEICGTKNSLLSSSLSLDDEELQVGVGNVFLPLLQKCTASKRKSGDDPVDDFGVSRGIKSANRKVVDSATVADECTVLGVSCNPKSFGKSLAASDEVQPKEDLQTLKILSYNVWFAEDIELRIRMRAIGDIIQLHNPDVICLQEVTPDIYAILQRSNWWKSYKCSLSFDTANTRPYFCMQLSKLPVKSYSCKQFSYSAMGRELCIAEVSAQGGTPLVVATTHLESPCPGPPKWDQMYSKERVKQAQEAVAFLKVNPNVIFCGDMNWDDKLDGEFPLPDGWIDAWTELNPKEIGWTYDTKSNPMLSANRKLQKRLDRFLVGLRDFKVECVEMVGTEAIPEVTYMKQKKGGKEVELPVLPSDHFGLLLTMAAL